MINVSDSLRVKQSRMATRKATVDKSLCNYAEIGTYTNTPILPIVILRDMVTVYRIVQRTLLKINDLSILGKPLIIRMGFES